MRKNIQYQQTTGGAGNSQAADANLQTAIDAANRSAGASSTNNRGFFGSNDNPIIKALNNTVEWIGTGVEEAFKLDTELRNISVSLGQGIEQVDMMNEALYASRIEANRFNISMAQLAEAQKVYFQETGRLTAIGEEGFSKMITASRALGVNISETSAFLGKFRDFGLSIESSFEMVGSMILAARTEGVALNKVMEGVSKALVNGAKNVTFKDGLKDLIEMSAQAEKFRFSMEQTFAIARNNNNLDQVLETTSKLATLGINIDPFEFLNRARNDAQGLQTDIIKMTEGFSNFNAETGEFTIDSYGRDILNEMASALGTSQEALMDMARRSSELNFMKNIFDMQGVDPQSRKIFEQMGQIQNGKVMFDFGREGLKSLEEVMANEDLQAKLQQLADAQTEAENADPIEIAIQQRDISQNIYQEIAAIRRLPNVIAQQGFGESVREFSQGLADGADFATFTKNFSNLNDEITELGRNIREGILNSTALGDINLRDIGGWVSTFVNNGVGMLTDGLKGVNTAVNAVNEATTTFNNITEGVQDFFNNDNNNNTQIVTDIQNNNKNFFEELKITFNDFLNRYAEQRNNPIRLEVNQPVNVNIDGREVARANINYNREITTGGGTSGN